MNLPGTPLPRKIKDEFWARLLLAGQEGPEVFKWVAFGRRLMLTVCALILVVGVGLSLLSALQMRDLVERSLEVRGRTIAEAAARAAFVPLSLEDEPTLLALTRSHLREADIVGLSIKDAAGKEWAGFSRLGSDKPSARRSTAPVRPPPGRGPGREAALGRVEVVMSGETEYRRLTRLLAASLAVNGLFMSVLLALSVVLIRNLTRNLQALVNEARWAEELRRSNLQLEEFAYVASHDLQSPLRKVAGFAELLRERCAGKLDAEAQEFIAIIVGGTRRMQRLIQDLLAYSHAGSDPVNLAATDLGSVLNEVLSDLEPELHKSGATVTKEALPVLRADRRQMGMLLQNLLENALKFHGAAPPVVKVSACRTKIGWQVSVQDNGIGFDDKHSDKIFKMFRRLHQPADYEGTGIGLAVARKIVERHGGRIWAESAPGRGATFRFTLAEAAEPAPPAVVGEKNGH